MLRVGGVVLSWHDDGRWWLEKVVKAFRTLIPFSAQSQERARQHSISANSVYRHLSRAWPARRERARVLLAHVARCGRCDAQTFLFFLCRPRKQVHDGDSDGDSSDVEVDGDGDDSGGGDDDDDNEGDATSFRHVLDDWMVGWLGGPGWLTDWMVGCLVG